MKKRFTILAGAALAIVLLGAAVAMPAFAQEPTLPGAYGPGGGQGGGGNECAGVIGRWHGSDSSLVTVSAEVLGMERLDLIAELLDGKTIAQVAEEQGVDPQAIVDSFVAIRAELLAEAVANGCITQEQADLMLEDLMEEATARLYEPFNPWGDGWCW